MEGLAVVLGGEGWRVGGGGIVFRALGLRLGREGREGWGDVRSSA